MKVDLDPVFSACFVEHDKDNYLEITITENGTVSFYDTQNIFECGLPLHIVFTSEELIWLANKAKEFKMRRTIYKRSKI